MWAIVFEVRAGNPHVSTPLTVYLKEPKVGCFCLTEALQFDTEAQAEAYRTEHHATYFKVVEIPDVLNVEPEEK